MSTSPPDSIVEPTEHEHMTSFRSVLGFLVGHMVSIADSELVEEGPVGNYLDTGFYEAKVLSAGADYLLLVRDYTHRRGNGYKEKIRLFLPIERIKRVVLMSDKRLIQI